MMLRNNTSRLTSFERELCQQTSLADCLCALVLPSIAPLGFVLIQLSCMLRQLCCHFCSRSGHGVSLQNGPPPLKQQRDHGLWLSALVSAGLLIVGAISSLGFGLLVPLHNEDCRVPPAWLVSPALESIAAALCALVIGRSRAATCLLYTSPSPRDS